MSDPARAGEAGPVALKLPWMAPADAFARFADWPGTVFFDSQGEDARARWSFLCVDPLATVRAEPGEDGLGRLEVALAPFHGGWPGAPAPFSGGAAGYIGYDMGAALVGVAPAPGGADGLPGMSAGLFDLVLAFDHAARALWLQCRFGAGTRAQAVLARLAAPAPSPAPVARLVWNGTREADHVARVAAAIDYIRAGDIYQANITARFAAARPRGVQAAGMLLALRARNPAPFGMFVDTGGGSGLAGTSPERFISLSAGGRLETRPIKGTRPRGATIATDAAESAALLASGKDRAENLMIVDLMRNDLARVAVPGSVRVPVLCGLESFARVHHLVSVVEARLRPSLSAIDVLRAAFPGGSVTGAPKKRAMEIIAELEGVARGPYCGAGFWIGFDGAMDSSILIRTLFVGRDEIVAQAGGGIVAESDPRAEWEETLVKLAPLLG